MMKEEILMKFLSEVENISMANWQMVMAN